MTKPRRTTLIVPGCLRAGNVLLEKVGRKDGGKFNGQPVSHVADDAAERHGEDLARILMASLQHVAREQIHSDALEASAHVTQGYNLRLLQRDRHAGTVASLKKAQWSRSVRGKLGVSDLSQKAPI